MVCAPQIAFLFYAGQKREGIGNGNLIVFWINFEFHQIQVSPLLPLPPLARARNQARIRLLFEALEDRSLLAGLGLVADDATHRVTVFEPDTFAVLGSVGLPGGPAIGDVAILGKGSKGFVTSFDSKVFPIDLTMPAAPVLGAAISIANPGEDISITPDQNFLVVSDGSNTAPLSVIQVSTLTQIGTFDTGADSNSVDLTSNGSVLVTSYNTSTVRRLTIDGEGTITNTGEVMAAGGDPNNVYSSPNGLFGVVVNRDAHTMRSFTVAGMTSVNTRSDGILGIAGVFSPAGDRFYVRTQSAVQAYAFDSATGALGAVPIFSIPINSTSDFYGIDGTGRLAGRLQAVCPAARFGESLQHRGRRLSCLRSCLWATSARRRALPFRPAAIRRRRTLSSTAARLTRTAFSRSRARLPTPTRSTCIP